MTPLAEALDSAKCVFFDFDGPICRLFSEEPSDDVAEQIKGMLVRHSPGLLDGADYRPSNPHSIMMAGKELQGDQVFRTAEKLLTEAEQRAALSARPTPFARELTAELHALGRTLAITSNNSAVAIRDHLIRHGLFDYFSPHIHGRQADTFRLKPDPDCLVRALESTGATPGQCVMIGDTTSDWEAARAIGVAFIGYAHVPRKARAFEEAGVRLTVDSMEHLLAAVRGTTDSGDRPTDD